MVHMSSVDIRDEHGVDIEMSCVGRGVGKRSCFGHSPRPHPATWTIQSPVAILFSPQPPAVNLHLSNAVKHTQLPAKLNAIIPKVQ